MGKEEGGKPGQKGPIPLARQRRIARRSQSQGDNQQARAVFDPCQHRQQRHRRRLGHGAPQRHRPLQHEGIEQRGDDRQKQRAVGRRFDAAEKRHHPAASVPCGLRARTGGAGRDGASLPMKPFAMTSPGPLGCRPHGGRALAQQARGRKKLTAADRRTKKSGEPVRLPANYGLAGKPLILAAIRGWPKVVARHAFGSSPERYPSDTNLSSNCYTAPLRPAPSPVGDQNRIEQE